MAAKLRMKIKIIIRTICLTSENFQIKVIARASVHKMEMFNKTMAKNEFYRI